MAYYEFTVVDVPSILAFDGCQTIAPVQRQQADGSWVNTGEVIGGAFRRVEIVVPGEYRVELRLAACCDEDPTFILMPLGGGDDAVVQPQREACIRIEGYPNDVQVLITDIMNDDGDIIDQIVRDIFGNETPAGLIYEVVECECGAMAEVIDPLLVDYYPIVITNTENGTPTEYSIAAFGTALPVLWREEDGTIHTGGNFSVTYNDDGPRDVVGYVPKDATSVTLNVVGEQVTELDVSSALNLTALVVNDNNITSLDTTQNVVLTSIVAYNNDLTTLETPQSASLTDLVAYNNNLTTLDVTQCVALVTLRVHLNNLTDLDVTQNVLLTNLQAYNNNLTILDVTQNVLLTTLLIYNNNLNSLDVTQNVLLSSLQVGSNNLNSLDVTQNVLLSNLRVENNNIVALDLTQNVLLTTLYAHINNLTVTAVNDVLVALDIAGLSNGDCRVQGQIPAAPPSGAGATAAANLGAKGWNVVTD